jgi:polygalacturonase
VGGRTNNVVQNVTFRDTIMENSQQSVRIKTISGANGTVDNINYRNIVMSVSSWFLTLSACSFFLSHIHPHRGIKLKIDTREATTLGF